LAWLITFNFVNIAWVFFRAKEWGDAIKVLSSMFSVDNIVLPGLLKVRLEFLNNLDIHFGGFTHNIAIGIFEGQTLPFILCTFLLFLLVFKNSMELLKDFKPTNQLLALTVVYFIIGILKLNEYSEFLYFRF